MEEGGVVAREVMEKEEVVAVLQVGEEEVVERGSGRAWGGGRGWRK